MNLIHAFPLFALMLTACASKTISEPSRFMTGAYSDHRALTAEDHELFCSAYKYPARLTPQSVATQVVAGTNYSFLCTTPNDKDVEVVIFQPLPGRGSADVSSIEPISEYDDVISFLREGFSTAWEKTSPESRGFSVVYHYLSPLAGYAIVDINSDGILELVIGDCFEDSNDYTLYDILGYDKETGKVRHIVCGGERDRYRITSTGTILEEGSNSAADSFEKLFILDGCTLKEITSATDRQPMFIRLRPFTEK